MDKWFPDQALCVEWGGRLREAPPHMGRCAKATDASVWFAKHLYLQVGQFAWAHDAKTCSLDIGS